ncbi:MAG: lysozyme [Bombella apis]|uniref:lysozyme n=1 Tax=Bombella apis TaxID=1785988 RepID=UPI0023F4776F|nr:lysozyme [Bombella apis]MCT6819462.1 lysozyme [Bombella apis]
MDTTHLAFALISHFEGCRLTPYRCPAGRWSIGYGATRLLDGSAVTETTEALTPNEADALLQANIHILCGQISALTAGHSLQPYQMAALISFSYNVGITGLKTSTLLRRLLMDDLQGAANEFLRWDKMHIADGSMVESPGLLKRREAERAMFLGQPFHS